MMAMSLVCKWHRREMATDNFPLSELFSENQGRSTVNCYRFTVLCRARERVVGIHNSYSLVVHATRGLPKPKTHHSDAFDCLFEILGELRLAIKPVWHMVKHFDIVGKHVQHGGAGRPDRIRQQTFVLRLEFHLRS